jgi:recombination protein RecT
MNTALEVTPQKIDHLRTFMDRDIAGEIAKVISDIVTPEKLTALVIAEAVRTPKIFQALQENPDSVATVCLLAAQLGLDVSSPLGHFWLIPRRMDGRMTLTHIVGAKGFIELARRGGTVVRAKAVYADEVDRGLFDWTDEPEPACTHRWAPGVNRDDDQVVSAYARAFLSDGRIQQLLMEHPEIEKRRAVAKTDNFWRDWYPEMCRKTVIRRLLFSGDVPLTPALQVALAADVEVIEAEPMSAHPGPEVDLLRQRLDLEQRPDDSERPAVLVGSVESGVRAVAVDGLPMIEQVQYWEAQCHDFGEAAETSGMNLDAAAEDQDPAVLEKYRDELKRRAQGRLL